jgi:hypothetical protein
VQAAAAAVEDLSVESGALGVMDMEAVYDCKVS